MTNNRKQRILEKLAVSTGLGTLPKAELGRLSGRDRFAQIARRGRARATARATGKETGYHDPIKMMSIPVKPPKPKPTQTLVRPPKIQGSGW